MSTNRVCQTHELLASASRGAGTVNSNWKKVGSSIEAVLMISVTAETGTATLDITVQISPDAGTTAITHTTCTQITATGTVKYGLTNFGNWIRVSAVVAGSATPTFTYSVHLAVKT